MEAINDALTKELEAVRARRRLPSPARLRALRERAGLNQAAVARVVGVTQSAVCRWESGLRRPEGELLTAYLALLDRLGEEVTRVA